MNQELWGELKKYEETQVLVPHFPSSELYSWFVIQHYMVVNGKYGETVIHIRTNGPGGTVYLERLK